MATLPVQTYYPQALLLQQCIECYYFLQTDDPDFSSHYYAFPHVHYSLNIHRSVCCAIDGHAITVKHDPGNNYTAILQGKYTQPLRVSLLGALDKVTIVFKPLGLNQFFDLPLSKVAPAPSQLFNRWDDQPAYHEFLHNFFSTKDLDDRVQKLEHLLLQLYRPLADRTRWEQALQQLEDLEQLPSIGEIASSLYMSERSFNRMFRQHFAITPVGYRQIVRFRHSLSHNFLNEEFRRLIDVGYASHFYDQSYFVKIYRRFTGESPSRFFSSVQPTGDGKLLFKFLQP